MQVHYMVQNQKKGRIPWCLLPHLHLHCTNIPGDCPPLFLLTQGMVLSAEYIKKKLEQEMVLSQAFGRDLVRGFSCHKPSRKATGWGQNG